ncbi:sensor histidine kinase [Bacillus alveayuensis]|uniref:sensor histidine kinase n=1 Tax=Aeribacillus alveayuensis TaxID=279215 RepID=UPI0005D12756|nr:HAMP domain-containing sensor histidine kinase [Bacillus alveayuensis]
MKIKQLSLNQKVLSLLIISVVMAIIFSFLFIHFLYKDLYIRSIKESLIYQGEQTAAHFHYGSLNHEIKERIFWYNVISPYEVVVVDKLDELDQFFPYKINYEDLISKEDEKQLRDGKYVMKEGYVKEFHRNIVGAIFPLGNQEELIGFIYIYVPLAEIPEVFRKGIPILVIAGALFFLFLYFGIRYFLKTIFKPLREMQAFSKEVGRGNFSKRVSITSSDEIGELAMAFNKMAQSLEQEEENKKEFLANVAHELRTPLTYIGGYSQILLDEIYHSPEELKKHLKLIQKETKRMQKLINDLLELNKLEDKNFKLTKEPIVLSQLILDSLELFQTSLKQRNIKLVMHLDDELIIYGDHSRLKQVFYNVVDNAIKYSYQNSQINISSYQDGSFAIVAIQDYGIGIPANDLNRIGERFYRTDKSRSRKTGGTGLGLSIVKEIMLLHDGKMDIKSEEGKGTLLLLSFPIVE